MFTNIPENLSILVVLTSRRTTDASKNESISFEVTVVSPTTRPNKTSINEIIWSMFAIIPNPWSTPSTMAIKDPAKNAHSPYLSDPTIPTFKFYWILLKIKIMFSI